MVRTTARYVLNWTDRLSWLNLPTRLVQRLVADRVVFSHISNGVVRDTGGSVLP
jgi:hypothetical protein